MRSRIRIDENKWKEISRRLGGADLNHTIDVILDKLLMRLVERGVEVGVAYNEAIHDTIEELTN